MPDYVLDASAAGKLFRNEQHAASLRAVVSEAVAVGARLLAPPVFDVELRNLAARTAREVRDPNLCYQQYEHTKELVAEASVRPRDDYAIAVTQGVTVHDAQYIDAARRHDAVLLSYDVRQLAAAAACGVETASPGLG